LDNDVYELSLYCDSFFGDLANEKSINVTDYVNRILEISWGIN
jgi:hypothetical protein